MRLAVSDAWRGAHPGAVVGILAVDGVADPRADADFERRKAELEAELRRQYGPLDRAGLKATPAIQAYSAYYRRFRKTYHVLLQLESVIHKGKSVPRVSALVDAMFMAELKSHLLTAGHDLDGIELPLRLDVGTGTERYTNLANHENAVKVGDMYIADDRGVLSSIVYGSDRRTRVTPSTRRALYTTYAPPGIGVDAVNAHLDDICANVRVVAPNAEVQGRDVVVA